MDEAQEKEMDQVACFKLATSLPITGPQNTIRSQNLRTNLLASCNRYGYVFYATEADGLALVPSARIEHDFQRAGASADESDAPTQQANAHAIIYRSYLPDQPVKQNPSLVPYWLALNCDESILAIIALTADKQASLLIFYSVVQLIQKSNPSPICPVMRLPRDIVGESIKNFAWNPAIPTLFAHLDGRGCVSMHSIDGSLKHLVKCDPDGNRSSICWSPKGKQLVVVKQDGSTELFDQSMQAKKRYPSPMTDADCPPCVSVLWVATNQFLLGFSKNDSGNNEFVQVMVTHNKDQTFKAQIFCDLFYDASDAPANANLQYFYTQLNDNKILICGMSESVKIGVLGGSELNQESYDVWTFPDHFRADTRGSTKTDAQRLTLTGLALSLNSTIGKKEFGKNLPPPPLLLIANTDGVLLVYNFIHKDLPAICRAPEVIQAAPTAPPPSNGFAFFPSNAVATSASSAIIPPAKETSQISSMFNAVQQTKPITNGSPFPVFAAGATPVQSTIVKPVMNQPSATKPVADSGDSLKQIKEFQKRLSELLKVKSRPGGTSNNLNDALKKLTDCLQEMATTVQTSKKEMKAMTSENIESLTKIENARHQLRLSQKENLHHSLKDRELDPWTQARLDSIQTRCERLKHDLNLVLQMSRLTIHDKSLSADDDENEDFIPDLEALEQSRTMKQCMSHRLLELSRKVTKTETDLQELSTKAKPYAQSSRTSEKPQISPERPFHAADAEILAYLGSTRPHVAEVPIPVPIGIKVSSTGAPLEKPPLAAPSQSTLSTLIPSTPLQSTLPAADLEGYKNMLRLVQTSIDIFAGVVSPEQLRELSNSIATSPLSSTQKPIRAPKVDTPSAPKQTSLTKTSVMSTAPQPASILQTPAKSSASAVPSISVTPATPAAQAGMHSAASALAGPKAFSLASNDQPKSQSASTGSDSSIRSLLSNSATLPPSTTPVSAPLGMTLPFGQPASSASSGTPSILGQAFAVSVQPPSSTITTSVQATSPTTKPLTSTSSSAFGAAPALGSSPLNLSSMGSSLTFGSASTATSTTTTTATATTAKPFFSNSAAPTSAASSSFGNAFGTSTSTAPTSTTIAGSTTTAASSTPSPFAAAMTAVAATTTTAAVSNPFAAPATTSTATAGSFGVSSAAPPSPFGFPSAATSTSATSIFGGGAATTTAAKTGIFGGTSVAPAGPFGGPASTSTSTTSIFGGSTTTTASPFGAPATTSAPTTSIFGGTSSSTASPFGAPAATSTASTGGFGSGFSAGAAGPTSPFGGTFTSPTPASGGSPFGAASPAPTKPVFAGFGGASTTASTAGGFGASPTMGSPTSSTAFGASPSFGSGFTGFGSASKSTAPASGFSFGGFGGQSSSTTAGAPSFASVASAAPPPAPSPLGGSIFGAPATATSGFGAPSSAFGSAPAQSAAPLSFTNYRK